LFSSIVWDPRSRKILPVAEFLGGTRLKAQGGVGGKKVATTIDAKSISEFITKFSELYVY
jgi:hypothetical protein